ncbi:MAG: CcmD family protein [Flavobacteriales bacterium]|nr:CcmD family protein [Flavobacteriales bacterium]
MKALLSIFLLFISIVSQAQTLEMAETMRSEGKIYVVIAVVLIILIGLICYLISIDRKLRKLEKELKN